MFQRWIFSLIFIALFRAAPLAQAGPLLPNAVGASWEYEVSGMTPPAPPITVTIRAEEKLKGKGLLRFETLSGGDLTRTELLSIDERGVLCHQRALSDGAMTRFDPPQILLPAVLKIGVKWELDDSVAGSAMHQQFSVAAEEDVSVPAGNFHAFRLHCEEPWPVSITIDRWFVPGTGFVKDITATRGPNGRLLSRVTTALTKFSITPVSPSPTATPVPSVEPSAPPASTPVPSTAAPMTIKLELAKTRDGEAVREFRSDAANIYVRWTGENLPVDTDVRIAWIAEDVGDVAPPNFVVDETTTTITQPEFGARFTLSRPKDGWAPGKYRAELFLNDELKEKVSVTIRE